MDSLIKLEGVKKEYPQGETIVRALQGIDLTIEKGTFSAIMGPSGCGKSTLMHMLGFLDRPSDGAYFFKGRDTRGFSEDELAAIRNRDVGFIFQSFNLLPRTTVLENVLLPTAYATGVDIAKARERALMLIERVKLSHRVNARPNQMSGGEQQRAAIARALINDPALVLADEPTGNLDSKTSDEVMNLLVELNREGHTIVMVTHEDDIARRAQRIIRVKDGRIIGSG